MSWCYEQILIQILKFKNNNTMKSIFKKQFKVLLFFWVIVMVILGCENDSKDFDEASYSKSGEVFIDGFSSGLIYAAFSNTVITAFQVDNDVTYNNSSASMRIDVPSVNDPDGSYAGGAFFTSVGRDLSGFDALTFWAKSSKAASIDVIGFGIDLGANKYPASLTGVSISTAWKKYIIPIPDASKLKIEKGMLYFSEGPENGEGYTFWLDEIKFEKLGTIAHGEGSILNGINKVEASFVGVASTIDGIKATFNLPNGINQNVNISPNYFEFSSSNEVVATVNPLGVVQTIGAGSAVITATLAGQLAIGSLTINSSGPFLNAPIPTVNASDVISVFSNTYTNVVSPNFSPNFGGSTTITTIQSIIGNDIVRYSSNNYTGIMFDNTPINGSSMALMHVDVFVEVGSSLEFQIRDIGANQMIETNVNNGFPTGDDKDFRFTANGLIPGWNSLNIPLAGNLVTQKNNLGAIILVGGPKFILDNIYFYNDGSIIPAVPTVAAPTPTEPAANVISIFSDAYTNVAGSNLNPNWNQATVTTQVPIAGNNTLKYAGLNYQGLQFGTSQNVASKNFLHLDYYTANSTSLKVYLISTGPVEKAYTLTVPSPGGWNSVNIPLSSFSPPVNLTDVIQMKFDGNGTIYLDNIYFKN